VPTKKEFVPIQQKNHDFENRQREQSIRERDFRTAVESHARRSWASRARRGTL
jgi:hypothetical protein